MLFLHRFALSLSVVAMLGHSAALAQEIQVQVLTREDGQVFVYHDARVGPGFGVHVERRDPGASDFVRLTDVPLGPARDEAEAAARFGEDLAPIQAELGTSTAFLTLFRIRAERDRTNLMTGLFPGAARALGRLYVDATAPVGQRVTYRVVLIGEGGQPLGRTGETTLTLTPVALGVATSLRAEHTGTRVTLHWSAPARTDAPLVGYHVYREDSGTPTRLTDAVVAAFEGTLDGEAITEWTHAYTAPATGITERLTVRAVDMTGQEGPPSDVLAYTVTDNVAPGFVENVAVYVGNDGRVEVTWPLSPEPDVAGYHVERATRTGEDYLYARLTDTPLAALDTRFVDEVGAGAGAQAYFYRVIVVDQAGNESLPSASATAQVEDHKAPPAPTALAATFRDDAVMLTWTDATPASDLLTYILERRRLNAGRADERTRINQDDVTATTYTDIGEADLGFVEGATYRFYVTARDSARNFSPADSLDLTIPNVTPPAPPENVRALSSQGHRVRVAWTPSPSLDVVAYRVRRVAPDTAATVETQATDHRDDAVQAGQTYTYEVAALDSGGLTSAPVVTTVRFLDASTPPAVRNVRARVTESGVEVMWEASPAPDVVAYRIEQADIATGRYVPVSTEALSGDSARLRWTHAAGTEGTWYRILALDASDNASPPSDAAQALVDPF
ncbi:MAG: hypothetical protein AAF624_01030 [Bacteroidota bacterium]